MSLYNNLTLYSYHYSSASWRVRAVLHLKGIPFKYQPVHLLNGEQHSEEFLKINPMHQVPALKFETADGKEHVITQSLAIIEFLEQAYPQNPIFPKDPILRAKSLAIAETISSGIQPLQNLETLTEYVKPINDSHPTKQEDRQSIATYWLDKKFGHLEELIKRSAGKYCVGDELSIADICLVPQMFNGRRFKVFDINNRDLLQRIDKSLNELEIIKKSHPSACPDSPDFKN